MNRCRVLAFSCGLLWAVATAASAGTIDLSTVLSNSGYEDDLVHSDWSETRPNTSYATVVPVNPAFNPLDPAFNDGTTLPTPTAPVGTNYIGVLNPTLNDDIKGKLAHDALAAAYTSGDDFVITVWGNRGRLGSNGNTNSALASGPPTLFVEFLVWGAGSVPTVDINDDWSRNPSFSSTQEFTNWAGPTQWESQTFNFAPGQNISYLAIAISGRNNNHDTYVAWDVGPVPEPSSLILAALGGTALALLYVRRRMRQGG